MTSNMELVELPSTSSAILEDIRELKVQMSDMKELKEQMRHITEQLARRDGNFDLSCSFKDAVEDTIDTGIDNATFSLPSPQRHTIDESLGK